MSAGWPGMSEVGLTTIAEDKYSSSSTDSSSPWPVQLCCSGTAPTGATGEAPHADLASSELGKFRSAKHVPRTLEDQEAE